MVLGKLWWEETEVPSGRLATKQQADQTGLQRNRGRNALIILMDMYTVITTVASLAEESHGG